MSNSSSSSPTGGGGGSTRPGIVLSWYRSSNPTGNTSCFWPLYSFISSLNARGPTRLIIVHGPRIRWSSFFEGRKVLMFFAFSSTLSPTWKSGCGSFFLSWNFRMRSRAMDKFSRSSSLSVSNRSTNSLPATHFSWMDGHTERGCYP